MSERWLITGASGQLGGHVVRALARDERKRALLALIGSGVCATPGVACERVDLGDGAALRRCVMAFRPTHIAHIGAMSAVGECYKRPDDARRINVDATRVLAEAAGECSARLVFTSTDMVFSGEDAPYCESDPPNPLSEYGRSKVAAERELAAFGQALTVRLPLMYGLACSQRRATFAAQLGVLRRGERLRLFTDEFRTPIWLADAAAALIALARSDARGVMHVAGPERLSRYELIERCARLLGFVNADLERISRMDIDAPEPRPADLSLDGSRFVSLFPQLAPGAIRVEALRDERGA